MEVTPETIAALPYPGLLPALRHRTLGGLRLHQAYTGYQRRIVTEHAHLGIDHRRMAHPLGWPQVEVEAVEVESLHAMASGFGLKGSELWIAQLLVGRPVGGGASIFPRPPTLRCSAKLKSDRPKIGSTTDPEKD